MFGSPPRTDPGAPVYVLLRFCLCLCVLLRSRNRLGLTAGGHVWDRDRNPFFGHFFWDDFG